MGQEQESMSQARFVWQNGAKFIKETDKKQPSTTAKCGRNCCNCFNGNNNDSFDNEFDLLSGFVKSISSGSFNDVGAVLKVNTT